MLSFGLCFAYLSNTVPAAETAAGIERNKKLTLSGLFGCTAVKVQYNIRITAGNVSASQQASINGLKSTLYKIFARDPRIIRVQNSPSPQSNKHYTPFFLYAAGTEQHGQGKRETAGQQARTRSSELTRH